MSDLLTVRLTLNHDDVPAVTTSKPNNHKIFALWCAAIVTLICVVMGLLWQKLNVTDPSTTLLAGDNKTGVTVTATPNIKRQVPPPLASLTQATISNQAVNDSAQLTAVGNVAQTANQPTTPTLPHSALQTTQSTQNAQTAQTPQITQPVIQAATATTAQKQKASPTRQASAAIQRAQFTSGINNKEPIDQLSDTIFSNGHETRKIYFFTELKNLAGSIVRHRWYYKNQLVVEIPINVQGNRWRSYSTKHIPLSMPGEWTVEVLDESENRLSKKTFTYEK